MMSIIVIVKLACAHTNKVCNTTPVMLCAAEWVLLDSALHIGIRKASMRTHIHTVCNTTL